MNRLLALCLLALVVGGNYSTAFAEIDKTDWKKRSLQIEERVNYIEKYLNIREGEKEKINNNSVWLDSERRTTISVTEGRFDSLACALGYTWYTKGTDDWPAWHKFDDASDQRYCGQGNGL